MRQKVQKLLIAAFSAALYAYAPLSIAAKNETASYTIIIQSAKDYANTPWAKLNIPAGTKLTTNKTATGEARYSLAFTGGVTMSDDGLSMDNSKGGAVMCAWEVYGAMKVTMDKCHPEETELRQNFDLAVEKLEKFIVANSLTPVTKNELETDLQKKLDKLPDQCTGEADKMAQHFIAKKSQF